jgi:hypothetical protein
MEVVRFIEIGSVAAVLQFEVPRSFIHGRNQPTKHKGFSLCLLLAKLCGCHFMSRALVGRWSHPIVESRGAIQRRRCQKRLLATEEMLF